MSDFWQSSSCSSKWGSSWPSVSSPTQHVTTLGVSCARVMIFTQDLSMLANRLASCEIKQRWQEPYITCLIRTRLRQTFTSTIISLCVFTYQTHWSVIHQVTTKKITTLKEVLGLNWHRFWRFYFSVYSLVFVWEDISSTRDSVPSAIQTPRISSKILRCASYFQLSSRCLDILMKHCLSCLIYYTQILMKFYLFG